MNITKKDTIGKIGTITLVFLLSSVLATSLVVANAQTPEKYTVSFAGDWTCSTAAQANGNNLKTHNVEFLQGLGDYSYETDQICWIEDVIGNKVPNVKLVQGNHEASNEDGNDASWKQLKNAYGITQDFFTVQHKNLYTIAINTQKSLSVGSEQYNFLKNSLEDAKAKKASGSVDYVAIASHKMFMTCEVGADLSLNSCGDHSVNEIAYKDILGLIFKYADVVDLVAQGHDHNTQLSKPLKISNNQLVVTEPSDPNAIVFGVFGGAGRTLDALPSVTGKPLWQFLNGADRQVPVFELDSEGKEMNVKFYKSTGAELFSATVVKNEENQPPPVEEICDDGIDNNGDGQIDENCNPTEPEPSVEGLLKIVSSSATLQDSGKEVNKMYDNDCNTRWSANGIGQKATFNFNGTYTITKIKIDGYHVDRAYSFKLNDKEQVYKTTANGNTCPQLEEFDISNQNIKANSITIVGQGNTGSDYNSYREVEFYGNNESTNPVEICGDGIDNNNNGLIDENCPPPSQEICGDGKDNDDDGLIDEGCDPSSEGLTHDNVIRFIPDNELEEDFVINSDNVILKPMNNETTIIIKGYEKID